jgi:hypothetical protein
LKGVLDVIVEKRHLFRKRMIFRRAPDWIQCELCERHGARLPARFVMAVDEEESEGVPSAGASALRLLCADCSALVEGTIDAEEWKRRTKFTTAQG